MTTTTDPRPPTLSEIVHSNIRAELARAGRSRIELQRHLDQKPAWMQRRYSGEVSWSVDEIEAIADWIGIQVETLFIRRPQ